MHHGKIDPQGSINPSFISNSYLPHIDKDILNDIMTIRGNFLTQRGGLSEEAAEKNWNDLMPWKDINQVFTTFGLKI